MIIVLIIIGIAATVIGCKLVDGCECEMTGGLLAGFGIADLIISTLVLIGLCVCLSDAQIADEKIAMYTEENEKIELQISEAIKEYQKYESGVFENVTPESAITLVTVYPELKSDVLVQKQIEVYLSNNEKIKDLKTTEIEERVYRWWLYFGGGRQ